MNTKNETDLYVTTFRNGIDVRKTIADCYIPIIKLPDDLPADAIAAANRRWEISMDESTKLGKVLEENMKTLTSIL